MKFITWFEAQYGKPPEKKSVYELGIELKELQTRVNLAQQSYDRAVLYNIWKDAAMKGWWCTDKYKKSKKP